MRFSSRAYYEVNNSPVFFFCTCVFSSGNGKCSNQSCSSCVFKFDGVRFINALDKIYRRIKENETF